MPEDRSAVLFDVDGTLVDTNWFHALTWWRIFQQAGEDIAMSRIHPLVGMGADQLIETLLGQKRSELKEAHKKGFEAFIDEIHAFPGAADLLGAVHDRGALVVLCTSAQKAHLEPMLEAIGADGAIDEIVSADDVGKGKPEPDIFAAALEKLDLDQADAIVVGDTRWDVEAAQKVGLDTVCVLTGGAPRDALLEAGAVAVYEDVGDLLAHLDQSPVGKQIKR